MNPIEFIEINTMRQLIALGYSPAIAQGGADAAVDHYKRCSQASKKGAMFDDCFYRARIWADKYGLPEDKPGKKPRQKKGIQPALF
ncbi:hypothetical protein BTJ39_23775 [Izhakiella australiensis]|uniref:Uncharacterized protein n=1 Tax=Izhakiella australiensis TaxID=1926881 RepID=A0A1S8Y6B0_9GAMM|nr:hypothetical protein [Izhakiella australiensis]OON34639.1 hypothetical protein BTJ39_23775 [Izhakiella australiensis]